MTLMNDCPFCKDFQSADLLLVKIRLGSDFPNFKAGVAVECQHCGMRRPMADQTDGETGDNIAIEMWNELVSDSTDIWISALAVRKAQKEFYSKRNKVGKTEHDALLHDALALEKEMDRLLKDHFSSKLENSEKQDKLL